MTPHYQVLLIAVAFASQIVVLSFYTPLSWQHYHAFLFKRYPREEYPRLHPLPRKELERKFALFRPMHFAIGIGAALTLVGGLIYADSPRSLASLMQMCLLVQLLPLYIALPLAVRLKRAFRAMPPPSPRSVELRKWRVTDFVAPLWIGLGIAGQVLALGSAILVYRSQPGTLGIFPTWIFSGGMLLAMSCVLSGYVPLTRADPYMSPADTFRVRQRTYRSLFGCGAVFGAWKTFVLLYNVGFVHFDVAYLFVGFSVIFQLSGIVLVSRLSRDLRTRDFSVYRAPGGAQLAR
jgi:hypothetical protein